MKVLFAVDGSAGSLDAVEQVAPLLTAGQDALAFYCSPPTTRFAATTSADVLARARQGLVDAVFEEARKRLPEKLRPEAETITGTADARHGIVTSAEEWGADVIVVGARGLGTFERLLLGSVSRAVVHAAKIPVWVARTGGPRKDHPGINILVACENPEVACRPAGSLSKFAWPEGSTCRTLTIVPSMFAGQVPEWLQQQARSPDVEEMVQSWVREHDEELQATRAKMQEFSANLPPVCTHVDPIVAEGEPADVILSTVGKEKIDLLVVGAYRKNWLAATLLGSTSEAVLNHAACSVLVVPHTENA
ncbi:MAG: universal stress protein [Planctomycetota bacterium]|nr:MAG: universal stress protein [Planctomycetota bacterium]